MISPSHLSRLFSALALTGALAAGETQAANALTPQEKLVVDMLAQRGLPNLLLVNEKKGHVLLIENGRIMKTMPAITGRTSGDDVSQGKHVTPAGIYPLSVTTLPGQDVDLSHPKASITYYDIREANGSVTGYSFHRVVKGREAVLAGKDIGAKRMSDGCVNMFDADFREVANYTMTQNRTIVYEDGTSGLRASWVAIVPENGDLAKTRQFVTTFKGYTFK